MSNLRNLVFLLHGHKLMQFSFVNEFMFIWSVFFQLILQLKLKEDYVVASKFVVFTSVYAEFVYNSMPKAIAFTIPLDMRES